ncbi:MAG: rod shape-determining protein MreD [Anaerolineaceae bacterium]|nr:rod shape-determining protein MreD [Anaerolineaceae bacterium]
MEILIAFPVVILSAILQLAVSNRLSLLNGYSDIVLIVIIAWSLQEKVKYGWFWALLAGIIISLISAVPIPVFMIGYLGAALFAKLFHNRIWQAPLLAMMIVVFISTAIILGLEVIFIQLSGINLPLIQSLTRVILPSILLNLLFSMPIYLIMHDIANWIYSQAPE